MMKTIEKRAFIIGNGSSRKDFDLMYLKDKGTVFGCNALYREFGPNYDLPDYLVAIDDKIIMEIESSDFPSKRFIVPPEDEQYEPSEIHWKKNGKPGLTSRSNAGVNAMIEAIKMGYKQLFMLGFDSMIVDDKLALSNLFDGTNAYEDNTRASLIDTRNRLDYIGWLIEKNEDVDFVFFYPEKNKSYQPLIRNSYRSNLEELKKILENH